MNKAVVSGGWPAWLADYANGKGERRLRRAIRQCGQVVGPFDDSPGLSRPSAGLTIASERAKGRSAEKIWTLVNCVRTV